LESINILNFVCSAQKKKEDMFAFLLKENQYVHELRN